MAAFLRSRFLAISRSRPSSRASIAQGGGDGALFVPRRWLAMETIHAIDHVEAVTESTVDLAISLQSRYSVRSSMLKYKKKKWPDYSWA